LSISRLNPGNLARLQACDNKGLVAQREPERMIVAWVVTW
jgi:hypothetical protein